MGREAALALAAEGCKVLIVARERGAIDETVEQIRSQGQTAEVSPRT
jgi:NAD(P)-dependent dehydrogenase (short-subunit alcohol dehydrogenase family)